MKTNLKSLLPGILLTLTGAGAAWAGPTSLRPLTTDAPAPARYLNGEEEQVIRTRFVQLDLSGIAPVEERSTLTIPLNLFDDVNFDAVFTRSEPGPTGQGTVWSGHLAGLEVTSWVIMSKIDDYLYMDVWALDAGTYQLRATGERGVHAIMQVDPAKLLPCGVTQDHVIRDGLNAEEGEGTPRDDGDLIDVLVMYTVAAKNTAGGTTGITNAMNGWIVYTNNAYNNSQMTQRVRLVHLVETNYVEATAGAGGMDTDLSRFRGTSDGNMDNVHALRNTYGADICELVSLSVNACGLAYVMSPPSSGFQSSAFGVTRYVCGASTFAHEMGHNMGCAHDHDNGGASSFCYSFGYRTLPSGGNRTIMAYAPGNEIPYFSNPNILFAGVPIGITEAAGCGNNTAADNARSMNNTRFTVANFRQQQVGNPPPSAFTLNSPADGASGVDLTPALQWQAAEFANNYTVQLSTEADMTPVIWEQTNITTTAVIVPGGTLDNCTQYFWSVTAFGFGGQTTASSAPADFTTALVGDINNDGEVNFTDLNQLIFQYGAVGPNNPADINGDGTVDFGDLNQLLSNYNQTC